MSSSTDSQEWSYTWATLADLADVQKYIHTHWQPDHLLSRDLDFLKWQYGFADRDSSLASKSGILLAKKGTVIGGMLGIIANECVDHGRALTAGWYAIWSVAEPYRQFGLGLKLLEAAKQLGYDVVGTLGANKLAMSMYRLLKYQIVPAMLRSTRLFSWLLLEQILAAAKLKNVQTLTEHWQARENSPLTSSDVLAGIVHPAGQADWQEWDTLWRDQFAARLFSVDRTASYLRQRYANHPQFRYEILFARNAQGQLSGCCVCRIAKLQPSQINMLRIVEYLGVDSTAYRLLGQQLEKIAAAEACAYADFNCTLRESHSGLPGFELDIEGSLALPKRLSPLEFTKTTTSVCWSFVETPSRLLNSETDVYLTSADGDQDRPN
jgi:hypothetical protein